MTSTTSRGSGLGARFPPIYISDSKVRRRLFLVFVCIFLLIDNTLYKVIIPIIPDYSRMPWVALGEESIALKNNVSLNSECNTHRSMSEVKLGILFASKTIVQLLCNPVSGTVIDRMGYDLPMMFGLCIIFISTSIFAFGKSYGIMFMARGLQGVGSAFADTAGLAMIADQFTEEKERIKALGLAIAFISFGTLMAPPFGGVLYQYCGKEFPFLVLAFIALLDGFMLIVIMQPVRIRRTIMKAEGNLPQGTPIHRLLMDPYIVICAGTLTVANVSLAFLEPTLSTWMSNNLQTSNAQEGLVWLPVFIPHLAGVISTIKLAVRYPNKQWLMTAVGLAVAGISCFFMPFCTSFIGLMIPMSVLCYGIALVDTAILPTMAFLVDTRHVSVYGSVYAIADISYNLAYSIGPIIAGGLMHSIGFFGLNIIITLVTLAYVPVLFLLRNCYEVERTVVSKPDDNEENNSVNLKTPPNDPYSCINTESGDVAVEESI